MLTMVRHLHSWPIITDIYRTPAYILLCNTGASLAWSDVPRYESRKGHPRFKPPKMALDRARRI